MRKKTNDKDLLNAETKTKIIPEIIGASSIKTRPPWLRYLGCFRKQNECIFPSKYWFVGGLTCFCLFSPPFKLVCIWKCKWSIRSETTRRKEHPKQSSTNKIKFIYQEILEKKKHYKYSNIVCWIFLCVYKTNPSPLNIPLCVCVCVCVWLTGILWEKT